MFSILLKKSTSVFHLLLHSSRVDTALNIDCLDLNSYVEPEIWVVSSPSQTFDSKIFLDHYKHFKCFSEILLDAIAFLNQEACQNRNFSNTS